MGLKSVAIIYLAFGCIFCSAQDGAEYIRKFPEKFTLRLGMQSTSNSFIFTDDLNGTQLELLPNDKTYLGASFLFRSVEVDLGFAPDFLSENKDNGDSKLFTLNFRMFLGRWMQTLDFYSQKGFFIKTDELTFPFPELTTLKIGGTTGFIFNPNFSFRAIGFQNEWQKKSAGSFIPRFSFYYTRFDLNDNTPEAITRAFDIAVGPGYYYNWVVKNHFIFSLGATLGFGVNVTTAEETTNTTALTQVLFRSALGYNSERFFTGINVSSQLLSYKTDPNTVQDDIITFVELYIGYRFNAPKKWVRAADKFNSKFGFD